MLLRIQVEIQWKHMAFELGLEALRSFNGAAVHTQSSGRLLREEEQHTLIQIVPRRTAEPNGVADYAMGLARALNAYKRYTSVFLSGTPAIEASPLRDRWDTVCVPRRTASGLSDAIGSLSLTTSPSAIVLHFSGYGFEKRGVPNWLSLGLRNWRAQARGVPLITIFHELYASSQPWNSAFWLSPFQKQIARAILRLSSGAITTTERYRDQLSKWQEVRDRKITAIPVFSNMGEPSRSAPPSARAATALVFGLAATEDRLFRTYRPAIERAIATLGIERIIDIGPRLSLSAHTDVGVPVSTLGVLPRRSVSGILRNVRFGFVAYPFHAIAKSSVFAAYAAHGVVPIVLSEQSDCFEGLEAGRHFIDGLRGGSALSLDTLAAMQGELQSWYSSHSLKVHADVLVELMTHHLLPSSVATT